MLHNSPSQISDMTKYESSNTSIEGDFSPTLSFSSSSRTENGRCTYPTISRSLSFQSAHLTEPFPIQTNLHHMMINIIMYTSVLPKRHLFKLFLQKQLLHFLRFRSIPVVSIWSNYWKPVHVELDQHIHDHYENDNTSVHTRIEKIAQRGYPRNRPRWEFHFIHNRQATSCSELHSESKNAIVFRVDHSITDGLSLVKTFQSLLTDENGLPFHDPQQNLLIRKNTKITHFIQQFYLATLFHKLLLIYHVLCSLIWLFKTILESVFTTLYQLYGAYDDDSPITPPYTEKSKTGLCAPKNIKLVKTPPINLAYVKALKNAAHCTINDILISALTGSLKRYFEYCNSSEYKNPPQFIRALLPYAFASDPSTYVDETKALRNRWTFISVNLHLDSSDPLSRLHLTHKSVDNIKRNFQPLINTFVYNALGKFFLLSKFLIRNTTLSLFKRHSIVFSSLPTYSVPAYLCGAPVDELYVGLIGLIPHLEIISYAGRLYFLLVADKDVVKYPEIISQFFLEELKELGKLLEIDMKDF